MSSKPRLAIIAGTRTPQAKAFGALASATAVDLGVAAVEGAIAKAHLSKGQVDEVVIGNVSGPADSANIARVISLKAGIPYERIAHTVNRNCASGMEALISSWLAILSGRAKIIVAGGTESMSRYPLLYSETAQRKFLQLSRAKTLVQRAAGLLPVSATGLQSHRWG